MGILYGKYAQGENGMDSRNLFLERSFYKHYVDVAASFQPLDLWESRHHYGRADYWHHAVYPSEYNLKQIPTQKETIFALDFVADAFIGFREEYKKLSLGTIASEADSFFIGEFEPKRGWVSIHKDYHRHMTNMYNAFVAFINISPERKKNMLNFDKFTRMFWLFFDTVLPAFPITRTGYLYSKYCNPRVSGLILEIMKVNHDKDLPKELMVEDINFNAYVATANKHGFYIDKNAPWRLIARVGSKKLENYMREYGVTSLPPFSHLASSENARDNNVNYFKDSAQIEDMLAGVPPAPVTAPAGLVGETSVQVNHNHTYYVDQNGNGFASLACHPRYQEVCHGHIIENWQVLPASSKVDMPFSKPAPWGQNSVDPERGLEMHIHNTLPPTNKPKFKQIKEYDNVFKKYFYQSFLSDMDAIKVYAITFYNSYVFANPILRESYSPSCGSNVTHAGINESSKPFYRKASPVTRQEMNLKYSLPYWLRNYIRIRAKETKQDFSEKRLDYVMKRVIYQLKYRGHANALSFINSLFDGTIVQKHNYTKKPEQMAGYNPGAGLAGVDSQDSVTSSPNQDVEKAQQLVRDLKDQFHY